MTDYAARVKRFLAVARAGVIAGVVLTVVGAGALVVSGFSEAAFASDRGEMGDRLEFESTGATYRLLLLADPLNLRVPFFDNPEAQILCTAALADGTEIEIDGARALTRTETDAGVEIGQFAAPAGPTTVTCVLKSDDESVAWFYSVASTSAWLGWAATAALVVGILLLIGAGVMQVIGALAKARLIPPSGPTPPESSPPAS